MNGVIIKSLIVTLCIVAVIYPVWSSLKSFIHITDTGWLFGSFVATLSALYSIMTAFIVFEVWSKYNKTSELVDLEATSLGRLLNITSYFRDNKLSKSMENAVKIYIEAVVSSFKNNNHQDSKSEAAFIRISDVIKDIKFDDDHDAIVFDHVISEYRNLSQTRTDRINQTDARLPFIMRVFLYIASFIMLLSFVVTPFSNFFYSFIAVGSLAFIIAMIIQMILDLDDPVGGHWSITSEPFGKVLKR